MAYFGENFLQGFTNGFFSAPGLKDYQHASKTFTSNGYELSPRYKFLFHVYFNINTGLIPALRTVYGSSGADGDINSIGLMVKNIDLPSYQIKVDTLNQYNRKRLVQTQLEYQPINIEFNDDQGDLIRNLWYNYYAYYYKDPNQTYDGIPNQNGTLGQIQTAQEGFGYNTRDTYDPVRQVNDWGYIGESYNDGTAGGVATAGNNGKPSFFKDITIYGLSQKKFVAYTLINPMITSWKHDQYDYSQDAGIMSNRVEVRYETVKYYKGTVGGFNPSAPVQGFSDPAHYDLTKSGIARPGSTATVFGQGGLIDAGAGVIEDLSKGNLAGLIGAVQTAGTAYNTFKGKSIKDIANQDVKLAAQNFVRRDLPGYGRQAMNAAAGFQFPKFGG
jgi:hypothetical protein